MSFDMLANEESLQKTVEALKQNGINVVVVDTKDQAKKWVHDAVPEKAEVMTMSSVSLDETGISEAINNSGNYDSVRNKLMSMDRETDSDVMQKLGAAPDWTLGSVHAVTEDGKIVIASNTGSQLPAYAYGSAHVIWVVGTQKIVTNLDEAMKRLNEYVLPLESERAHKAYGVPGSNISKLLIINKEVNPERLTVVFVKEKLGF